MKFADKPRHTLFLEPEGWDTEEIYINGLSTSLPEDVQRAILREIPGLDAARRCCAPATRSSTTSRFPISCSSRSQRATFPASSSRDRSTARPATRRPRRRDSWAGVNAALAARGEEPFGLARSEAYAAVMVDDLTTKGLEEPYRLFSSRAEYRLLLGVDSAIPRLMPHALRLGLVSPDDYSNAMRSEERVRNADSRLAASEIRPDRATQELFESSVGIRLEEPTTLRNLLKRNDLSSLTLSRFAPEPFAGLSTEELAILESRIRYEGYIRRETEKLERLKPLEDRRIPESLDYRQIPGLSWEVVEKCSRRRPRTVGEAGRIPGVTPAAVAIICAHAVRDRAGRTSSP